MPFGFIVRLLQEIFLDQIQTFFLSFVKTGVSATLLCMRSNLSGHNITRRWVDWSQEHWCLQGRSDQWGGSGTRLILQSMLTGQFGTLEQLALNIGAACYCQVTLVWNTKCWSNSGGQEHLGKEWLGSVLDRDPSSDYFTCV